MRAWPRARGAPVTLDPVRGRCVRSRTGSSFINTPTRLPVRRLIVLITVRRASFVKPLRDDKAAAITELPYSSASHLDDVSFYDLVEMEWNFALLREVCFAAGEREWIRIIAKR